MKQIDFDKFDGTIVDRDGTFFNIRHVEAMYRTGRNWYVVISVAGQTSLVEVAISDEAAALCADLLAELRTPKTLYPNFSENPEDEGKWIKGSFVLRKTE